MFQVMPDPEFSAWYETLPEPLAEEVATAIDVAASACSLLAPERLSRLLLWFDGTGSRSWLVDPAKAGGGPLFDIASHRIDVLNFLFGQPLRVQGQLSNVVHHYAVEDNATVMIEYAGGVRGVVDVRLIAMRVDYAAVAVSMHCNHVGVRVRHEPPVVQFWGVHQGRAALVGVTVGLVAVSLTVRANGGTWWSIGGAWLVGASGVLIGAAIIKAWRWLSRMAG